MPASHARPCRRPPVVAVLVLCMASTIGPSTLAASAPPRAAAPDLDLLEYLGRMEGSDGAWVGPDDMAAVTDEAPAAERSDGKRQATAGARVQAPPPVEERRHVE
jgi:hypothetical protein